MCDKKSMTDVVPLNMDPVAIKIIRGVGDAESNSSLAGCWDFLVRSELSGADIEEINWSEQHFVPRAFSSTRGELFESYIVLDHAFLRRLGAAFRTAAMLEVEPLTQPPRWADRLRRFSFAILQQAAPLAVVAGLLLVPGFNSLSLAIVALLSSAATMLLLLCAVPPFHRLARATLRAVLLLLLWPLIFLGSLPATQTAARLFSASVLVGAPILIVMGVDAWLPGDWIPTEKMGSAGIPAYDFGILIIPSALVLGFFSLVSIGVVMVALYAALSRLLAPIYKVLADIVLYLGDPSYHVELANCVTSSVVTSLHRGAKSLVFITHSLGTVICVDVLRRFGRELQLPPTTLITGGSPLRRFFHRFFPKSYPAPVTLYSQLRSEMQFLRWINVYRPRDPVGAALGLPAAWDVSTKQRHSIAKAHLGYWSDEIVYATLTAALASEAKVPASDLATPSTTATRVKSVNALGGLWVRFPVYLFLACLGFYASWQAFLAPRYEASDNLAILAAQGTHTRGLLFVYTERTRGGDFGSINVPMPRYTVTFPDSTGHLQVHSIPTSTCQMMKLHDLFPSGTKLVTTKHPDGKHAAALTDIDITYLVSDPRIYTIDYCKRERVPLFQWVSAWLAFLSSFPPIVMQSYALVRRFFVPALAALSGLTEGQFHRYKRSSFGIKLDAEFDFMDALLLLPFMTMVIFYLLYILL